MNIRILKPRHPGLLRLTGLTGIDSANDPAPAAFRIAAMLVITSFLAVLAAPTVNAQSIWDGVYTEEQAQRGAEQYSARCVSCHGADLRGNSNAPSLLGMSFMFIWEGRTLGEMFGKMRNEMPTDQPGSLPAGTYADILAFILKTNEFPAGEAELAPNQQALEKFTITSQAAN